MTFVWIWKRRMDVVRKRKLLPAEKLLLASWTRTDGGGGGGGMDGWWWWWWWQKHGVSTLMSYDGARNPYLGKWLLSNMTFDFWGPCYSPSYDGKSGPFVRKNSFWDQSRKFKKIKFTRKKQLVLLFYFIVIVLVNELRTWISKENLRIFWI